MSPPPTGAAATPPPDTLPGGPAGLLLLLLLAGVLLLSFPGSRPIRNPDETRDAEIAREFAAGDWTLLPLLNGRPYHAKPPLFFQAAGLVFRASGGPSDAAARVAGGLFGVLAAAATWWIGERLLGRGGGLLAGAALVGTPWFLLEMRSCTTDTALTGLVAAAVALLVAAHGRRSPGLAVAGGAVAGLAALSKQVHGLVFPFLAVGVWLLVRRDGAGARAMRLGTALAAGIAVTGTWVLVLAGAPSSEPGMSALASFAAESGARRFGDDAHHAEPPWYHLIVLLRAAPWTLIAAPAAVAAVLAPRRAADATLLPATWFLALLAALSLPSGKRETYLLPLVPAVALLAAASVASSGGPEAGPWGRRVAGALARLPLPRAWRGPRRAALALAVALGGAALGFEVLVDGPAEAGESGRPLALRAAARAGDRPLVLFRTGKGDVGQFLFPLGRTLPVAFTGAQLEAALEGRAAVLLAETGDVERAVAAGRLDPAWVARWRPAEEGRAANTRYTLWEVPAGR